MSIMLFGISFCFYHYFLIGIFFQILFVMNPFFLQQTNLRYRFVQKQMGLWKVAFSDEEYPDNPIEKRPEFMVDEHQEEQDGLKSHKSVQTEDLYTTQSNLSQKSARSYIQQKTKFCLPLINFFRRLLSKTNRVSGDVYIYIFLFDFINFFVLVFGFTSFGNAQAGDGGVASYLQENNIPIPFLIMLLLHFIFIVVDRALYLRKFLLGKIIFQIVSVIGMHIWLFIFVPSFSERSFNTQLSPVMYYGFKFLYFLFSAYQIRCGYPKRNLGHFLTKGFTMFNLVAFKMLEKL